MSKTRSLLILFSMCVAVGITWVAYTPKGKATPANGPNLTVREDVLGSQWVVRDENIAANACSAIEGEVTPGLRKLVRFTVMTPNTGNQDVFVGDPNVHVAANDGLFEFASCHHHYHFRHYALYELVDPYSFPSGHAAMSIVVFHAILLCSHAPHCHGIDEFQMAWVEAE